MLTHITASTDTISLPTEPTEPSSSGHPRRQCLYQRDTRNVQGGGRVAPLVLETRARRDAPAGLPAFAGGRLLLDVQPPLRPLVRLGGVEGLRHGDAGARVPGRRPRDKRGPPPPDTRRPGARPGRPRPPRETLVGPVRVESAVAPLREAFRRVPSTTRVPPRLPDPHGPSRLPGWSPSLTVLGVSHRLHRRDLGRWGVGGETRRGGDGRRGRRGGVGTS